MCAHLHAQHRKLIISGTRSRDLVKLLVKAAIVRKTMARKMKALEESQILHLGTLREGSHSAFCLALVNVRNVH